MKLGAFFDKVPLNDILKAAVWNQSSTFAKFCLVSASCKFTYFGPNSCCPKSGGGGQENLALDVSEDWQAPKFTIHMLR